MLIEKSFLPKTESRESELNNFEVLDVEPPEGVDRKDTPVVFCPGFTQGAETQRPNLENMARLGRRCLMVDAPGGYQRSIQM